MPAVTYTVSIDGAPASQELLQAIQQIEVEDHASMADMLRLRVVIGVRTGVRVGPLSTTNFSAGWPTSASRWPWAAAGPRRSSTLTSSRPTRPSPISPEHRS